MCEECGGGGGSSQSARMAPIVSATPASPMSRCACAGASIGGAWSGPGSAPLTAAADRVDAPSTASARRLLEPHGRTSAAFELRRPNESGRGRVARSCWGRRWSMDGPGRRLLSSPLSLPALPSFLASLITSDGALRECEVSSLPPAVVAARCRGFSHERLSGAIAWVSPSQSSSSGGCRRSCTPSKSCCHSTKSASKPSPQPMERMSESAAATSIPPPHSTSPLQRRLTLLSPAVPASV